MTQLWKVSGTELKKVHGHRPDTENTLEEWIAKDPSILNLDILLIGRQCITPFGKRLDLLGIDRDGHLTIIELKRDLTPRDVVAQILDYASWVYTLTTKEIYRIAEEYLNRPFDHAFKEKFGIPPPDTLNTSHNLVIVAREFDETSKRIVGYLANVHGVSINTAFFGYFKDGDSEYLSADWLMDQERVVEQSQERTQAPWTGFYYINSGLSGGVRSWSDLVKFGFIVAGGGRIYSDRLSQLSKDDPFFAYHKGAGYIGYGIVKSDSPVMAKDFITDDGQKLSAVDLAEPKILRDSDNPDLADYVVAVEWKTTFPLDGAKWLDGGFANQNIVCKLRHRQTLDFLMKEFGALPPQKNPT